MHPHTLSAMNNLAILLKEQGKLSEAEPLFRDVLRCERERLGDTHPDTLSSMSSLANLLSDQGKLSEAELLCREVVCGMRETLGADHEDMLTATEALSCLLTKMGKPRWANQDGLHCGDESAEEEGSESATPHATT
jgi:hypothetical protein